MKQLGLNKPVERLKMETENLYKTFYDLLKKKEEIDIHIKKTIQKIESEEKARDVSYSTDKVDI